MLEIGRLVNELVQLFEPPGRWLFVKIVVLCFSVTAIARIVPWKPRRTLPKKSRRTQVALRGIAAVALVGGLTGSALVVSKAERQFSTYQDRPAHATLAADVGSYLGVYEAGSPFSFAPLQKFSAATHTQPNIDLYYSSWGLPFQAAFAQTAYEHGSTTLIQMMPSGSGVTLAAIAAGQDDAYLDRFAAAVRAFRHGIIIGFGPEMNGNWYAWGYTKVPPATWVAAWRHLVSLFRRTGTDNVTWLWTANEVYTGSGPLTQYWPGRDYVNWVGIDAYFVPSKHDFQQVIGPTLAQVRRLSDAPVIISETGIAPAAGKPATLQQLFAGVRANNLLGFVYFDANQLENADYHYSWRLEDSQAAVDEYSLLARQNASMPHPSVAVAQQAGAQQAGAQQQEPSEPTASAQPPG
jgi:hypothetical protein